MICAFCTELKSSCSWPGRKGGWKKWLEDWNRGFVLCENQLLWDELNEFVHSSNAFYLRQAYKTLQCAKLLETIFIACAYEVALAVLAANGHGKKNVVLNVSPGGSWRETDPRSWTKIAAFDLRGGVSFPGWLHEYRDPPTGWVLRRDLTPSASRRRISGRWLGMITWASR